MYEIIASKNEINGLSNKHTYEYARYNGERPEKNIEKCFLLNIYLYLSIEVFCTLKTWLF